MRHLRFEVSDGGGGVACGRGVRGWFRGGWVSRGWFRGGWVSAHIGKDKGDGGGCGAWGGRCERLVWVNMSESNVSGSSMSTSVTVAPSSNSNACTSQVMTGTPRQGWVRV
jgi:hypothetical protein